MERFRVLTVMTGLGIAFSGCADQIRPGRGTRLSRPRSPKAKPTRSARPGS